MDLTLFISGGVIFGCLLALSWFAGTDAPFVPSQMDNIRKILKQADVKKGKRFYELGSGDGRVVIEAAKLKAQSIGIEQSWLRVLLSKYFAFILHIKNTKFLHGNIFSNNYSDADIIYIYLLPKGVKRLQDKLKKELKKGTIVITQTYHFPNKRAYQIIGNFKFYRF